MSTKMGHVSTHSVTVHSQEAETDTVIISSDLFDGTVSHTPRAMESTAVPAAAAPGDKVL